MRKSKFIIGIDEVGRGPLAGPVAVAAVLLPTNYKLRITNCGLPLLRDSKKLSAKQREKWFKFVKENKIPFAIANVWPKTIDKINITKAANLAASRCLEKLSAQLTSQQINQSTIFLDGGLYLNSKFKNHPPAGGSKIQFKTKNLKAKTIIHGDELVPAVSLASIVAKVHRDNVMKRLHKKHPQYGFDKHKGYGTKLHFQAIKKYGISGLHRKSFLKSIH